MRAHSQSAEDGESSAERDWLALCVSSRLSTPCLTALLPALVVGACMQVQHPRATTGQPRERQPAQKPGRDDR